MKLQDLLPIGTKVMISPIGCKKYPNCNSNPHNTEGVIELYDYLDKLPSLTAYYYRVQWDNGTSNSYKHDEISVIISSDVKCVEVPESFVREAYKAACADWKKKLDTQFPELKLNPIEYFSIGSKFKIGGNTYMLVKTGRHLEVTLIDPECGQAWSTPFTVFTLSKITKEEMNQVTGDFKCIKNTYKK